MPEPLSSHVPFGSEYRPDVDGLRGVAALSVVVAHLGWLPGGEYGVDLFFVISGFLISGIILRDLETKTFSIVEFYSRRVNRIFPALITLLLVVGILGWTVLPTAEHRHLGEIIGAGAAFSENFWVYANLLDGTTLSKFLLAHLWTLGIEEQFYLLWPLSLLMAWRMKVRLPTMIVASSCISFISFAWTLSISPDAAWLFPWNRLWELALGGLLACVRRSSRLNPTNLLLPKGVQASAVFWLHSPRHLEVLGAVCVFVPLGDLLPSQWWPGSGPLMSAIGSFLLIAAGPQGWINRYILSARPLVLVGLFSYPLYLWHLPLLLFADILYVGNSVSDRYQAPVHIRIGVAVLSILLSYLTYMYLERPIRSSQHTKKLAKILCAVMAVIAVAAYCFLV